MDAAGRRAVKRLIAIGLVLLPVLPGVQPGSAFAQTAEQGEPRELLEVKFLLEYIGGSGCDFYRNGSWKDAQAARAHLNDKYRYLKARGEISTAEEFIEKVATASSITGEPYQVRCHGGAGVATRPWLLEELVRLRVLNKRPASGPGVERVLAPGPVAE